MKGLDSPPCSSPLEPLDALRRFLPEALANGGHPERLRAAASRLGIKIDGAALGIQLATILADGKASGDLQHEDVILVHGLLLGDRSAIAHFYGTVQEALPRWLRGLPVEHDEVVQRLVIRLGIGTEEAERLRRYNGVNPFFSWIRVVATNIATDLFRERARFREFEEGDARTGEPPSVKELSGPFQRSLKAAFQALELRAQTILIWHYRHQIEVDRIARVWSVHRVTASRWLADARDALRRGTYERLRTGSPQKKQGVSRDPWARPSAARSSGAKSSATSRSASTSLHADDGSVGRRHESSRLGAGRRLHDPDVPRISLLVRDAPGANGLVGHSWTIKVDPGDRDRRISVIFDGNINQVATGRRRDRQFT